VSAALTLAGAGLLFAFGLPGAAAAEAPARTTPELRAHTSGWVQSARGPAARGGGFGLGLGVRPLPAFTAELDLQTVVLGFGAGPSAPPALRVGPALRLGRRSGPALGLGYSLAVAPGLSSRAHVGMGWVQPLRPPPAAGGWVPGLELEARLWASDAGAEAASLGLGLRWAKVEAVPAPPPAAPPVEPPPAAIGPAAPLLPPLPEGARLWLPHPVCAWLLPAEAEAVLAALPPEARLIVVAEGMLPAEGAARAAGALRLVPAPRQGGLLVVAEPGDVVEIDGQTYAPASDGVVEITAPEGFVTVRVRGGGREEELAVAVADGEVTWARPAAPAPLRVRFARGSAALTPAAAAPLSPLVAAAGGWRFTLQGSASPDGDPAANAALAAARCGAVARALVAAGLPPGALREAAPAVASPTLSAEEARACVILPTPPVSP
jgi:hypothetical protein